MFIGTGVIHPFLVEIGNLKESADQQRASGVSDASGWNGSKIDTGAAALHLAIRCASLETVTLLLSHRTISPTASTPDSGTTLLYLAPLSRHQTDVTLVDAQGRTARDVARGKEVIRNAEYRSLLRSFILSPFPASLPNPNVGAGAGGGMQSPVRSSTRHDSIQGIQGGPLPAPRRRDLRLLELAVRAGADVFVRERRGKLPGRSSGSSSSGRGGALGIGKGERGEGEVKPFLRQLTNQEPALLHSAPPPSASAPAPVLRGYLNKNTRWFVLKEGVLSYYRHQDDEAFASRGSMAVKNCVLKPPAGAEGMRFEIHSGAAGRGGEKWYMKANHPVEAGQWVAAISASVAWVKAREADNGDGDHGRGSTASGAASVHGGNGGGAASIMSSSSSTGGGGSRQRLVSVLRKSTAGSVAGSIAGSVRRGHGQTLASDVDSEYGGNGNGASRRESGEASPRPGESDADNGDADNMDADGEDDDDDDDGRFDDSSASASIHTRRVAAPHEATFELLGNSATAQLELTLGLVGGGAATGGAADALRDALGMVSEFVSVARERDAWWRRKLSRARAKQSAWERSLASAVREGEALERELRLRSRKRGSRFFDAGEAAAALAGGAGGTLKARNKRGSVLAAATVLEAGEEEREMVASPVGLSRRRGRNS
ncbi:hypothetical protein B0H19DRAFT_1159476 [Mycena capillaripes]|nr:hypothetical protein B0H19DRAFT_1159476 [Mycena capillaripes]